MDLDESGPGGGFGLAEVGEVDIFVGWAPDRLGGEVEVGAEKAVELAGPEHEVDRTGARGLKVRVDYGEDGSRRLAT